MRRWTKQDTSWGISFGLEMVGCILLFSAASLAWKVLGGALLAAGTVPWFLPTVRDAIAKERQRDARSTPVQNRADAGKHEAVEQGDEADER